jgi:ABC-type microcin C transport system permease subunit YejB
MRRLILMNMTIMSIITITTTIIQTLDPKKRGAVAPRS